MQNNEKLIHAVQPVSGLRWLRIAEGIIILNANLTKKWMIKGIEANLWEWVSQGFSYKKMVEMVSKLLNLNKAKSEKYIKQKIFKLEQKGLLEFLNNRL